MQFKDSFGNIEYAQYDLTHFYLKSTQILISTPPK